MQELKNSALYVYSLTRRVLFSHYHKEAIQTSISPEATEERDLNLQAALMNLDFILRVVGNN